MKHVDKEAEDMAEKLVDVRSKIGDLLTEDDLSVGEVVSLLMSMLIQTSYEAGISPMKMVGAMAQGCEAYEEISERKNERGEMQWLN
jgi:hypothetical protein